MAEKQVPGFVVAIGVHTGPVVSGEVGSADRRHYTVVGDTVDVAGRLAQEALAFVDQAFPILFSISNMKEAGLFLAAPERIGLSEVSRLSETDAESLQLYTIADPVLLKQSLILEARRSI
jgi:adenylate cyclase